MAGKGMRTKVGQVMPDGKVFCNNSMLLAAKRSHSKIEGASKALGSGSAESMATAKAAALAVAPPHVRAAAAANTNRRAATPVPERSKAMGAAAAAHFAKPKHVELKGDLKARDRLSNDREALARMSKPQTGQQRREARVAPYAEVLNKMKNFEYGDGSYAAAMREGGAELRAIRNQRSQMQNRSGAQGDLFGGFKPKREVKWEPPSAQGKAAPAAVEKPVAPKAAPAPFERTINPAAKARVDAIRASRVDQTAARRATEERYRTAENAAWRKRDAWVGTNKDYAALTAKIDKLDERRNRMSNSPSIDAKIKALQDKQYGMQDALRAQYAQKFPQGAARLAAMGSAKVRAVRSADRQAQVERDRQAVKMREYDRKVSDQRRAKEAVEQQAKEKQRLARVAETNRTTPVPTMSLNYGQKTMARGAYARLNKTKLAADAAAKKATEDAGRAAYVAKHNAAVSGAPVPPKGYRNLTFAGDGGTIGVKAVKSTYGNKNFFVHRQGDTYYVASAASGLNVRGFDRASDASRFARGVSSGKTIGRALSGDKRATDAFYRYARIVSAKPKTKTA